MDLSNAVVHGLFNVIITKYWLSHKKVCLRLEHNMLNQIEDVKMSSFYDKPFSKADQNGYLYSVYPDEMACHEPSHQDLHCLQFCL